MKSVYIFNLGQPDIIYPINGFSTTKSNIDFLFSDIGAYINQNVTYSIEIDTTVDFNSAILITTDVSPKDGTLKWESPQMPAGLLLLESKNKR